MFNKPGRISNLYLFKSMKLGSFIVQKMGKNNSYSLSINLNFENAGREV